VWVWSDSSNATAAAVAGPREARGLQETGELMDGTRAVTEARLAEAIDAESLVGIHWWPGNEMAPIAYRRWFSFARRHRTKGVADEQRITDLAKGLQAHYEPDRHTPFSEWEHLAAILARVLDG